MRLSKSNCYSKWLVVLAIMVGVFVWHRNGRNASGEDSPLTKAWTGSLAANDKQSWSIPDVQAGHTYALNVSLRSGTLGNDDRLSIQLEGPGNTAIRKDLHAGDPDLYTHYRP